MDVSTFFVSYAQATKLIQPREGPFHNPPPSSQTAAVFRIAHGQQGQDVAGTKPSPELLGVIGTVTQHTPRTTPRTSSLTLYGRNRIDERQSSLGVVTVGPG